MSEQSETPSSETPPTETPAPTPSPTPTPTPEPTPAPTPAPEASFAPLTVENLQFPEGFQVAEPLRDQFLSVMNDEKLTPADRAQALIGMSNNLLDAASEANSAAWDKMQETWQDEVRNDPQIGGTKFQGTMESIGRLVEEFGSPELRQILDDTGAGNSIHVIRFLASLSSKLTEGSAPRPGLPTAEFSEEAKAARMYPSMKNK